MMIFLMLNHVLVLGQRDEVSGIVSDSSQAVGETLGVGAGAVHNKTRLR